MTLDSHQWRFSPCTKNRPLPLFVDIKSSSYGPTLLCPHLDEGPQPWQGPGLLDNQCTRCEIDVVSFGRSWPGLRSFRTPKKRCSNDATGCHPAYTAHQPGLVRSGYCSSHKSHGNETKADCRRKSDSERLNQSDTRTTRRCRYYSQEGASATEDSANRRTAAWRAKPSLRQRRWRHFFTGNHFVQLSSICPLSILR